MIRNAFAALWDSFWFRMTLLVAICSAAPAYMLSIAQTLIVY